MFLGYLLSSCPSSMQLSSLSPSSILQGKESGLQSQTDWFESQFFLLLSTGAEGTISPFFPSVSSCVVVQLLSQ